MSVLESSHETLVLGLPVSAYLQPIFIGTEAETEVWRAFDAGGLSADAFSDILGRLSIASDVERVDIVNQEHLLSPASPDPDRYHREECDCGLHGRVALGSTVKIAEI